jgi:hypothetical protein
VPASTWAVVRTSVAIRAANAQPRLACATPSPRCEFLTREPGAHLPVAPAVCWKPKTIRRRTHHAATHTQHPAAAPLPHRTPLPSLRAVVLHHPQVSTQAALRSVHGAATSGRLLYRQMWRGCWQRQLGVAGGLPDPLTLTFPSPCPLGATDEAKLCRGGPRLVSGGGAGSAQRALCKAQKQFARSMVLSLLVIVLAITASVGS